MAKAGEKGEGLMISWQSQLKFYTRPLLPSQPARSAPEMAESDLEPNNLFAEPAEGHHKFIASSKYFISRDMDMINDRQ